MLCKYYIKLGTSTIEDSAEGCIEVSNCIRNLDSLKVSYARTDLGGVVRKCGSEIEFTGQAYEAIVEYYNQNYLQSCGVFAVFIADNNWRYTKLWDCPLDFATLHYDGFVATLGCVDNGAAAIIKANEKTKYEFNVSDINDGAKLLYNGVENRQLVKLNIVGESAGETTMKPSAKWGYYFAAQYDGYHTVYPTYFPRIGVAYDSFQSTHIVPHDQEEQGGIYKIDSSTMYDFIHCPINTSLSPFIECIADIEVLLNIDITFLWKGNWFIKDDTDYLEIILVTITNNQYTGRRTSVQVLKRVKLDDVEGNTGDLENSASWDVGEIPFKQTIRKKLYTGETLYFGLRRERKVTWVKDGTGIPPITWDTNESTAETSESPNVDNPEYISVVSPNALIQNVVDKMFEDKNTDFVVQASIQDNGVVECSRLLAAESARRMENAKIYTTFKDFANFMSAVFGYVYQICETGHDAMLEELSEVDNGERTCIDHFNIKHIASIRTETPSKENILPASNVTESYSGEICEDKYVNLDIDDTSALIVYCENINAFLLFDFQSAKVYRHWEVRNNDSKMYHENGIARENLGFCVPVQGENTKYYYIIRNGAAIRTTNPHTESWLDTMANHKNLVKLLFTHRKNVFVEDTIKVIESANNMQYTVNESEIYSSIEVGYPKNDYQNGNSAINEFNTTVSYSTGTDITDNKLSLVSPYRADCYGIEELMSKTNKDESTSSDNHIFVVMASGPIDSSMAIDRSVRVWNAYTDTVFNAALAPNVIVKNNEEYIGSFAKKLTFTSSDGNSSAVIGGLPMSTNINIAKQLFKSGKISIDTGDIVLPDNWNGIIEFEYNGRTYRGYLDSIDINFAYAGTLTYNLIEKCIE